MKKNPSGDDIAQVIFTAADEVNKLSPPDQQLAKSMDTVLYGDRGALDSLGLVNLIVLVEQGIQVEFGAALTLADEKALSRKNSPFRTMQTFSDYICGLLKDREASEKH